MQIARVRAERGDRGKHLQQSLMPNNFDGTQKYLT
jgi:hypothetical protein